MIREAGGRAWARGAAIALALLAVSAAGESPAATPAARPFDAVRLAVLPIDNLTSMPIPAKELRQEVIRRLADSGLALLDDASLEQYLRRHRVRWTGGLTAELGRALWNETGSNLALVVHLHHFEDQDVPRIGLAARLVATGDDGVRVAWATSVALAGDQRPGLLDLGVVTDPAVLFGRAFDQLAAEILEFLQGQAPPARPPKGERRFRPRSFYRMPDAPVPGKGAKRIAVLPFTNDGWRRQAGEIVANHMLVALVRAGGAEIVEPGEVRRVALDTRLIQYDGPSFAQAQQLMKALDVDLVVAGNLLDIAEAQGFEGIPGAVFTTQAIDPRRDQAAWVSFSDDRGDDAVYFFDIGSVRSVDRLLDEMIAALLEKAYR